MPNIVPSPSASLDVEVISSANPDPSLLRAIRYLLQQNEEARQVLIDAQEEDDAGGSRKVNRQRLLGVLSEAYPHEGLDQVVEYLSDEFEQLEQGVLLISPDSGKAIARVTQDSLYEAAPVPRESGNMVERGLRIRPDVEAYLAYWSFENARESDLRSGVIARLNQTELQREEGDPRTLVLSKKGRRTISQQVHNSIAEAFLDSKGPAKNLLKYFPVGKESCAFSDRCIPIKVLPLSQVRRRIQDQLSVNPKHDALTATLASVTSSWARSILGTLLEEAAARPLQWAPEDLDDVVENHFGGVWVCEPNLAMALMGHGYQVFPVTGPPNVALQLYQQVGYLELDESKIGTSHREVHDRWTVEAAAEVTLHVCWEFFDIIPILGEFSSGVSVEVV